MEDPQQQERRPKLAPLPEELAHFDLETFRDRSIQSDILALLVLPR